MLFVPFLFVVLSISLLLVEQTIHKNININEYTLLTSSTAGYSEDSDYTSDFNYPVGHPANSSASQYRNLQTPQRSLEISRENSHDKEDRYPNYEQTDKNVS